MRARPCRRDGLSLLEVIVAMAVFLICLVGLVELLSAGGRMATDGQKRSQASRLCLSKLAEVQAGAVPLEGQTDVSFEEAPDFTWSLETEAGPAANLQNVTL